MADLDTQAQINRLIAERDLLLGAIRPEEYALIADQFRAISETPDMDAHWEDGTQQPGT